MLGQTKVPGWLRRWTDLAFIVAVVHVGGCTLRDDNPYEVSLYSVISSPGQYQGEWLQTYGVLGWIGGPGGRPYLFVTTESFSNTLLANALQIDPASLDVGYAELAECNGRVVIVEGKFGRLADGRPGFHELRRLVSYSSGDVVPCYWSVTDDSATKAELNFPALE